MSAASDLLGLQELDLARDGILSRLEEIEESLNETEEMIAARQEVAEQKGALEELKSRQADLEMNLDDVRTKATEVEGKLYSGKVTSPKELSDLDLDLKSLRTQVRKREDELLAHLVDVEEAEAQHAAAAGNYRSIESEWQERHEELLAEKERLEPELVELTAKRSRVAAGIDPRAVALYSQLRERKYGVAVARVERGMCQGCRITLPAAILQRARGGAGLVQCVSCERILLVS